LAKDAGSDFMKSEKDLLPKSERKSLRFLSIFDIAISKQKIGSYKANTKIKAKSFFT
jgi:hypothetical protein